MARVLLLPKMLFRFTLSISSGFTLLGQGLERQYTEQAGDDEDSRGTASAMP